MTTKAAIETANVTSASGLTAVDVEMDTETGKGLVTVRTYGRVTHTVPLQGEQMADDDTNTKADTGR